jgi:pilus assembly protein CpaE
MLEVISKSYTHSFIDFPANIEQDLLQVLIESSTAFLVTLTPELPSLWRTDRLLRFLANAGGTEKLRLIVNRVTKDDEIDEKAIVKTLDRNIYWKLPNNYRSVIEAINEGKPVVKMSNSALVSSYMKLAQELSGKKPEEEPSRWRRIFS